MQIRAIILYSFTGETRILPFKLGKVNIITGQSNTGKSTLLEIVEYCLGKSDFLVSEGEVRDKVSWYAVLYQLEDIQVLVAKSRPATTKKSNSEVYFETATDINIPAHKELKANTDDEGVVKKLSELLGIEPNISFSVENQQNDRFEVSLNQAKFYLFQSQNTLANKEKLFQGAAEAYKYIAQAIRNSLPYFLGAVPKEYYRLTQEYELTNRSYKALSRKLKTAEAISGKEYSTAKNLLEEAKQVGLIISDVIPNTDEELISILNEIRDRDLASIVSISENRIEDLQEELDVLREEFQRNYQQLKLAEKIEKETNSYSNEVVEQSSRLASINLFDSEYQNTDRCPVCASEVNSPVQAISAIKLSLKKLQTDLRYANRSNSQIVNYIFAIKREREELRRSIEEKEFAIRTLMTQRSDIRQIRDSGIRTALVVGRISFYLDHLNLADENSLLRSEVDKHESKVSDYEKQLNSYDVEDSISAKLDEISQDMTRWAEELHLEYRGSNYRFDLKKLTVTANRSGKYISMDNMGGGENWLGCHLIVFLGLHKYFIEHNRPVPSFLMLDQPTQVYFPDEKYKSWKGDPNELTSDDRIVVNRLYEFLFNVCESLFPNLQIIVTDHANLDTERFQQALVEDPWRGGRALIPKNWITREEAERRRKNQGQMSMFDS